MRKEIKTKTQAVKVKDLKKMAKKTKGLVKGTKKL